MATIKTSADAIVSSIMGAMKFEIEFGTGIGTSTWRAYLNIINISLSDDEKEAFFAELKSWKDSKGL